MNKYLPIQSKSNLVLKKLLIFHLIFFLFGCSSSGFLKGFLYPEDTFGKLYVIRVHAEPTGQLLNIYINKKLSAKVNNGSFIDFTVQTGNHVLSFDWPPIGALLPKHDIKITVKENQNHYLLINHINKNIRSNAYNPDSILNVLIPNDSEPDTLSIKSISQKEATYIMDAIKKANIEIKKNFIN